MLPAEVFHHSHVQFEEPKRVHSFRSKKFRW
jgi:hypothetical protein